MKRFLPLLMLTGLLFGQDTTLAIQEQAVEGVETDFNDERHTFEVVSNLLFEIYMWREVWLKYDDLWAMGFISPSFLISIRMNSHIIEKLKVYLKVKNTMTYMKQSI